MRIYVLFGLSFAVVFSTQAIASAVAAKPVEFTEYQSEIWPSD